MKRITLCMTLSLGLLAAPALADRTWTWTGPKGGEASGTTSCSNATGVKTCQGTSTYTSPKGQTFQSQSTATGDRFGGQRVITTTGPNGKTATSTRIWKRN